MEIDEPTIRMAKDGAGVYRLDVFSSPGQLLHSIPLGTSDHADANKLADRLIACIVYVAGFSPTP